MMTSELYDVREIQPNNRSAFAKKVIKKNQKLMYGEPYAWATLKSLKSVVCNWCLMKKQLFRCSSCKCFYYCSAECQKKDWSLHKLECKIFQNMVNVKKLSILKQITTEFVLNIRIAVLINKQPDFKKLFFSMVTLEDHQQITKLQYFQEIAVVLLENLGTEKNQANLSQMMRQLNIVAVNAFTIQDFLCQTDGVAIGIYNPANLINHDCQPNCTQYYDGRYMMIVANRQISFNEELSISYTDPLTSFHERKKFLRQNYLFQCFCEQCQIEKIIDFQSLYILCPECQHSLKNIKKTTEQQGEEKGKDYECTNCKKQFSGSQVKQIEENANTSMKDIQKEQNLVQLKKKFFSLKKRLSFNHPFFCEAVDKIYHATINHMSTSEFQVEKQNKLMEQAYIILKQQIKGLKIWYRLEEGEQKSVRFFIKYAQLGKLCYNLKKFQKAFIYTETAMQIINICNLKNIYQEVQQLKIRFKQLQIQMSMAKAQVYSKS